MAGYYCKFVQNYGRIAGPLTSLLKKYAFSWNSEASQAFQKLKEAMCKDLVLVTPNFTKTFIVECDYLGNGIVVVLMQEGHPLSFTSHIIKGNNLKGPFMRRKYWK